MKKQRRLRAKANSWKRLKHTSHKKVKDVTTVTKSGGCKFEWHNKKGVKYNFSRLGLIGDINEGTHLNENIKGKMVIPTPGGIENESILTAGASKLLSERTPEPIMSLEKQVYWSELILKHGSDYKAMERDVKLNKALYTEEKCKKMCELYMKQMAAPILPSAVLKQ